MPSHHSHSPDQARDLFVESSSTLLAAMSHAVRLEVLSLLSEKEWCVSELAQKVELSSSALSQHLKRLRDAKFVHTRRSGQNIYYRCDSQAVSRLLLALEQLFGDAP